eukprot:1136864-Pelagomonas_calceolata.AAC.4
MPHVPNENGIYKDVCATCILRVQNKGGWLSCCNSLSVPALTDGGVMCVSTQSKGVDYMLGGKGRSPRNDRGAAVLSAIEAA